MMGKNNTVKEIINVRVNGHLDNWLSCEVSKYYDAGSLHKNSKIYVDDINEQAMVLKVINKRTEVKGRMDLITLDVEVEEQEDDFDLFM